ncbi:hypothetical protein HPP92_003258 [Vanilla planifolia]|uniref:Uncharacterized protein n=1 Tax=Vanilla planifolia TaxID=51239 RepID=A0A835VNG7_VANPL|nr:hypothetical protein HPP92_003258 [Vanilla planifolia]
MRKEASAVVAGIFVLSLLVAAEFQLGTVMAGDSSKCMAVPPYVAESCAAGDVVFDGFRVCCDFLRRAGAECNAFYLREIAAAGVDDVGLFSGCKHGF